jgi:hypothetical protein
MKRDSHRLSGLLVLLFAFLAFQVQAQENSEAIIIQKITHDDGSVTTVKKRVPKGEDVQTYAEEFDDAEGELEIHILSEEEDWNAEMEGETIFLFRQAKKEMDAAQEVLDEVKKEMESLRIIMHEGGEDYNFDFNFDDAFWTGHSEGRHVPRTRKEKAIKPFVGIYPGNTDNGTGVRVTGVVSGAAAQAAGIQQGDIINSLNGLPTNGSAGLRTTLLKLQPGQRVTAEVVRDGQVLQIPLTLGEKAYYRSVWNEDRDPCEVFIGVYVGGRASIGEGVEVTGIIGNTPASTYGVEGGDIILAMDGISVNNNDELLVERDKHDAGDEFVLTILRNGAQQTINARFKTCEEIEEEEIALPETNQPELLEPLELPDNALELGSYSAFPNPTFGRVRVQFTGQAVPTQVQISDASGRVVYEDRINNFDGRFDQEIDLGDATPGTLILTIRQDDKLVSKQIVLLNRA